MARLRAYIAGASAEADRVRHWMDQVECQPDMQLTLDWLAAIEAHGGLANQGLSDDDREAVSAANWRAIQEADVVWLLAPQLPSAGAWVELGLAIASGRVRVLVSGPARLRSIFCALAEEHDSDHEAWGALVQMAMAGPKGCR